LEFKTQIAELLASHWVTDCHTLFAEPVIFLITLDHFGHQMNINYQAQNASTTISWCLHPYKQDRITLQPGSTVINTFDRACGDDQLCVHPNDRYKTASAAMDGFYLWMGVPLGLPNVSSVFYMPHIAFWASTRSLPSYSWKLS